MIRNTMAILSICVLAAACASAGGDGASLSTVSGQGAEAASADANRITAAEIAAADLPNAYELVSRLRRPWLRRDPRTGAAVAVYMDDQRIGAASKLREIPAVDVAELHFLPYDDAVRRWGTAVEGSVIVVVRRR